MDPLSALSMAASIVQFVDFGMKITSEAKELYDSNERALHDSLEIEQCSARLQVLTGSIKDKLRSGQQEIQQGPLDERSKVLERICTQCIQISMDFVTGLEKVKVSHDGEQKNIRLGLKGVLGKEKTQAIVDKLTGLRDDLNLHIQESLR
jgi:hypothetical protein